MSFFDDLGDELGKMSGSHEVSITISVDEKGYLDRACPKAPCARGFKVLFSDDAKFGESCWCAYCGEKASCEAFTTPEQERHFLAAIDEASLGLLDTAFAGAAARTNARLPEEFPWGTVSETVDVPVPAPQNLVPPTAWELMRVETECSSCRCRFAGLGAIYFCPACGDRSPELTLEQNLRRLRVCIASVGALEATVGKSDAADLVGKLLDDGIQSLVTAFESFAKDAFRRLAPTVTAPKNVFQRLGDGGNLWSQHGGRLYEQIISIAELEELKRYFQQRHVLGHNSGIIDQHYLTVTGDSTYRVGQRLALRTGDVTRMADIVERLTQGMATDLPA